MKVLVRKIFQWLWMKISNSINWNLLQRLVLSRLETSHLKSGIILIWTNVYQINSLRLLDMKPLMHLPSSRTKDSNSVQMKVQLLRNKESLAMSKSAMKMMRTVSVKTDVTVFKLCILLRISFLHVTSLIAQVLKSSTSTNSLTLRLKPK